MIGLGEEVKPPVCPALPSGTSAYRLVSGDPSGVPGVIGHTVARAALIGTGMAVAGERRHLVRNAIGGALAIEAFVLVWASWRVRSDAAQAPPPAPAPAPAPAPGTTQGVFFP
jgi:hypothetical protein